jgi:AhpD family alkylhydroperoxidase
MAWVALRSLDDVAGPAREVAESGVAQYGQLLNTWGALLNRPEIFAAYLPFLRSVAGPGELEPRIKDLSAVLVGWLNGCRYTVSHRSASAARNGVSDDDLRLVIAHSWESFDAATRCALAFTEQLTCLPTDLPWSEAPQCVDAELLREMSGHFTDPQLVELAMSVSIWNGLARFHRVMGFDLDMPDPPEGTDPAERTI